jgi:hypothetical protein
MVNFLIVARSLLPNIGSGHSLDLTIIESRQRPRNPIACQVKQMNAFSHEQPVSSSEGSPGVD